MKEMVGGCCVCSDERGWPENPLVYCDGQNCSVAVHQACYGIVSVPTGPWYCRKCESQERSARVRCELCPSRDGALKKTDNQGWAHVVCALYIPEVRFGNVATMEPIILQLIPPERYSKTCYICQEIGKGSRANVGACMQCNKSGCKQQFHVTCAQGLGLLCEEAGNYLDNVKYCGYCHHHYSKLKKGGNVKTIPPYKPITHETGSSDATSSSEKELEPNIIVSTQSSTSTDIKLNSNQNANSATTGPASSSSTSSSKQRKLTTISKMTGSSSSSSSSANVLNNSGSGNTGINTTSSTNSSSNKSSSNSSSGSKDKDKHSKSLSKISSSSKNQDKESSSTSSSTTTLTRDKSKSSKNIKDSNDHSSNSTITSTNSSLNTSENNKANNLTITTGGNTKDTLGQKFTTSNFTESIVIQSESVFGSNEPITTTTSTNSTTSSSTSTSKSSSSSLAKKRKADTIKLSTTNLGLNIVDLNNSNLSFRDIIKDVSVTLIPLPIDKTDNTDNDNKSIKKPKTETNTSSQLNISHEPNLQNLNPNLMGAQIAGNVTIKQTLGALQQQPQQQQQQQQTTTSSTSSSSHIKPQILKDLGETRLRSSSPYNSSSAALGGSGATTPSLYVSVPLSTATVPGVNLPSTTSIVIEHVTLSQPSRSNPIVNHHHHPHSHHSSSNSNQSSSVERQSPRNDHNQSPTTSTTSLHPSEHSSATPSVQSTSGIVIQTNVSATSSTNHGGNLGITSSSSTTLENGSLKITYEKQNLRVAQLQEEQLPARRSRSQSGDSSNKSRSGKKRSAANVVVSNSVSSTSSSSSSSSTTSSMNIGSSTLPALPIGSNTGNQKSPTATSSTVKTQNHCRHHEMHLKSSTALVKIDSNENSKNLIINSTSNAKTSSSSSSNTINDVPIPPVVVTPNNSHLNNINTKQLNKKLLRPQQSHSQQLQQQKPQQSIPTPVSATENTTTTITTSTTHFSNDENPVNSTSSSNSRTPDNGNFNNNNNTNSITISSNINNNNNNNSTTVNSTFNNGGLKFTYESQIGSNIQSLTPPVIDIPPPVVKDSPPSSPGSEAGSARKRGQKSSDSKDIKLFHNGVHATHMLGNQLNPASSMAPKMFDQLHMEIEAHSVYTQPNLDPGPQLVGIPFPGKQSSTRSSSQLSGSNSLASLLGGSSATNVSGNTPRNLEQLLERQWEQGSQFLMEQAQHFDIASLLSCLHQLRTENIRLEEHVNNLVARRDHLLAVNARLAIPLNPNLPQNQATLNNIHINGPTTDNTTTSSSTASRISRPNANLNAQPLSIPLENGIDFRHSSHPPPTSQTTISRHYSVNSNYSSSTSSAHNQRDNVLSSSSSSRQQPGLTGSTSSSSSLIVQPPILSDIISRGSTNSNSSSSGGIITGTAGASLGIGGGGSGNSYHSATQQSAYSALHQSQLRQDDNQGKPS